MSSVDTVTVSAPIGHKLLGTGPVRVVVMNDWLCDTSTWDVARTFLDGARFTYAFADLRGYGQSRGRTGTFTLKEAAADVLALADCLGWNQFAIVGHSMSSLVALHLAQHHAARIERAVVLTPPPPTGMGADDAMLTILRSLALADDATRTAIFTQQFGTRLTPTWAAFKAAQWRAAADPEAAAGYVSMFARDGLTDPTARITIPLLAITGEQDSPPMRHAAVTATLSPLCAKLSVRALADSSHYPMQEMPPLTVSIVEQFLGSE